MLDFFADRVVVIAEAGVNHDGDLTKAFALVDAAADAGADVVKFQTFRAADICTKAATKADYQLANDGGGESQFAMLSRLELPFEAFGQLAAHCRARDIAFLSTAFDPASLELVLSLRPPFLKIPSGEITNLPYLRTIGSQGLPVLLSTGMSELHEVADALDVLAQSGCPRERVVVLQCTTNYPAPLAEVNLRAMQTMAIAFPGVRVGFSDHTEGLSAPLAAVALGACVIEKHFTLDKTAKGPDHAASIEPDELAALVRGVREVGLALGQPCKCPSPSEKANRAVARKSLVAARAIAAGEVFTVENVAVKRPGTGLSPMLLDKLLGQRACRDFAADELLEAERGKGVC